MTPRYTSRPFDTDDVEQASALLAARQARLRKLYPSLPARYEDPSACVDSFRFILEFPRFTGIAAERDGRLAGYLLAFAADDDYLLPSRHTLTLAPAHALREGEDAGAVYQALYAAAGAEWVEEGRLLHVVHCPAGHPATDEAWANLGFGRRLSFAVRDLRPLGAGLRERIEVRESTRADLDLVVRLAEVERAFHSQSPMFRPFLGEEDARRVRDMHREYLGDPSSTHLIASVHGRELGVITLIPARGSPLFIPDGSFYIAETGVIAAERSAGIGTVLLDAALSWGRERGFANATLHFSPPNPISPRFWTGHGFQPVMHHLERRLDERIVRGRREG